MPPSNCLPFPTGDVETVARIEEAVAADDAAYTAAEQGRSGSDGHALFHFAGGASTFNGDSPFTNTYGFGLRQEHESESLIAQIEEFFFSHKYHCVLSLSSLTSWAVLDVLRDRGYRVRSFQNVFAFDGYGDRTPRNSSDSGFEVKEISEDGDLLTWARVASSGYFASDLERPDPIAIGQSQKEGCRFLMAYIENEPVATASLYTHKGVGRLGGMATLAKYRRRGIHRALIRVRIEAAREMGCTLIASDCHPGAASQRNLEIMGFRLVHVRTMVSRLFQSAATG